MTTNDKDIWKKNLTNAELFETKPGPPLKVRTSVNKDLSSNVRIKKLEDDVEQIKNVVRDLLNLINNLKKQISIITHNSQGTNADRS